jgi:phosphomannomutase / phosphoglucomutase
MSVLVAGSFSRNAERRSGNPRTSNLRIVSGDEQMIAYSRSILKERSRVAIIGDVKCLQRLYEDVASHGGRPIMWKTSHWLIKSKLKQQNTARAGEMSGHMFFNDRYYSFDDAIYASFRLLEILSREGRTLGALLADLPQTSFTPEIWLDCPDDKKFEVVRKAADSFRANYSTIDIDGAGVNFPADGASYGRQTRNQLRSCVSRPRATKFVTKFVKFSSEN